MAILPFKFFAYIGPRHVPEDDTTTPYGHWNYILELVGAAGFPPPVPYLGLRSLTTTMSAGSVNLVTGGGALPPAAGVWVGPNGAGQGWEYMAYYSSGSVKTALREIQVPQSGVHTAGAPVYLWYPLTMNNGGLQYDEEQSDNFSTITWTAKLSGVQAPASVLKPEHIILITGSNDVRLTEAQVPIVLLGTIERVQMSQDTQLAGTWEIDIVCTSRLLQTSTVPSLRLGPLDIALQADVDASSSLGAKWKLTMPQLMEIEANTRPELDLIDAQADCGPQNTVDGNEDTLWVSDGWLGNRNTYANTPGHEAWASVFCYPVSSQAYGSKYIEIINTKWLDAANMYLFAKWRSPDPVLSAYRMRWYKITEDNFFQQNGIDSGALHPDLTSDNEKRLIIAEDLDIFKNLFPAAKATFMLDASNFSGQFDIEDPRRVWWQGGALFFAMDAGESHRHDWLFSWGDTNWDELEATWLANNIASFELPSERYHLDNSGIRPGMVIRRNFAQSIDPSEGGGQTMSYIWDYLHHPGYVINTDITADTEGNPSYRSEWIRWVLPEMSHALRDDIQHGDTIIYIVDAQGNPNVEGISKHLAAGTIVVDDEDIPFTGKDYKLGTLTGCTVQRKHKRGTKVLVRWNIVAWGRINLGHEPGIPAGYRIPEDGMIKSVATSAYPLAGLEWGRGKFKSNGNDRFPFIGDFVLRFSIDPEAPDPTRDSYENGYLNAQIIDSENNVWGFLHAPSAELDLRDPFFQSTEDGFRPRTVLMQLRQMWTIGGAQVTARPALNYFRALADPRYFNPDTWLDTEDDGFDNQSQIMELMKLSGQYDNFFFFEPGEVPNGSRKLGQTDRDTAWRVASDMADYGISVIRCQRDATVWIGQNDFLLTTSHEADHYLTDDNIISLEIVNVRPAEVGQVRLTWEDPHRQMSGVVAYPLTARYGGGVVEVGPMLLDNESMAATVAQNLYRTKRYPYNIFVEYAQGDWDTQAGQIHEIRYDFLRNGQLLYKLLMVETVSQSVSNGVHHTQVGYREIDRTTV